MTLCRRKDDVARVRRVLKGRSGLLAANPFGKEVGRIFDVRNVADLDLPTLEALQKGKVAT